MTIPLHRIKSERKRLGLTQQQIADACDITRIQWGRLERGQSKLGGRVLKAFVGTGANLNYLLTGEHSKNSKIGKIEPTLYQLNEQEANIIEQWRQLQSQSQELVIELIAQLPKTIKTP